MLYVSRKIGIWDSRGKEVHSIKSLIFKYWFSFLADAALDNFVPIWGRRKKKLKSLLFVYFAFINFYWFLRSTLLFSRSSAKKKKPTRKRSIVRWPTSRSAFVLWNCFRQLGDLEGDVCVWTLWCKSFTVNYMPHRLTLMFDVKIYRWLSVCFEQVINSGICAPFARTSHIWIAIAV